MRIASRDSSSPVALAPASRARCSSSPQDSINRTTANLSLNEKADSRKNCGPSATLCLASTARGSQKSIMSPRRSRIATRTEARSKPTN